jgi:hypothetical protein
MIGIKEVPDLNLGPETGYPDLGFRDIPQSLQATVGQYLKIWPLPLPFKSFPSHH